MTRETRGGFTLIELAVAVFVITLLLGTMLVPLTTQVEQRKIADTQRELDETREAIIGFAILKGRLPRPAVSYSDGTERAACANEAECTGFIPWTALGTAKLDAWGKIIRYSVTPAFANSTFALNTGPPTKTVKTRLSTGSLINLASAVPAVIFSYGADNYGTTDDGKVQINSSSTNLDEQANDSGTTIFYSRVKSGNSGATGGEFDDILVWISPNILFNRMVTAGKLP